MKELIDKLSLGIIDYEIPSVVADVEKIELSLMPGENCEGSFRIENHGQGKLKGIIYSSDRHVKIKNKTFSGDVSQVHYIVDTGYLNEGTELKGDISIVSNGGEVYIPFFITVKAGGIHTSIGDMRNMFHFADLVQKDYDEALRLFCSKKFSDILLKDDYVLRAKYDALIQGTDKNIAMDEFLIVANKKKPTTITVSEEERYFENPEEDYEDKVILQKDNWGYVKAIVECDEPFLRLEKTTISSDDFVGNLCEIPFLICENSLHEGFNYAVIKISSLQQTWKVPVKVYKKHEDGILLRESRYLDKKRLLASLYRVYLSFRMKKMTLQEWMECTFDITEKMRKIQEDDLFVLLVQTQLMIVQGKEVEAKLMLEEASKRLEGMFSKDVQNYCFYLYVRALKERRDEYTKKAVDTIRQYYENGWDNWQLLWLIMYLDENYDRNESLKLIRIKEQYDKGMRSPLMYYESLAIYNNTPSLLRVLDEYERQVIFFGIREDYISEKLIARVIELCSMEKVFQKDIYHILSELYGMTGRDKVLSEIVGMLIKAGKTDSLYFPWYEKAVERNFKLTGLYEYYMYSMNYDYEGKIPDVIFMYFVYNITLKGERLDFLYKKVIEYKDEAEHIYHLYEKNMEKYAFDSVREGRMNDKLAVVYQEMLPRMIPDAEVSEKLPEIINTYLVMCNNPAIREVVVIHKEMDMEEHIPFMAGKAYVRIYSEDAAVVFCDIYGNRYIQTVSYQKKKLLQMESLLKICYEIKQDTLGLQIYFNDKYFRYRKYADKAIEIMEKLVHAHEVRPEYKAFLEKEIIEYYAVHSEEGDFQKYLSNVNVEQMGAEARKRIIELCITRGLPKRGFCLMTMYGCNGISGQMILKCVDQTLEMLGDDKNTELLYLAVIAYRKGKYNENTLNYISEYYYGSTRDMYKLWTSVKNFGCESRILEEKIVVQMLFTGEYENHIGSVFESYLENGASEKVKRAYLIRKSYDYFVKETSIEQKVFEHIRTELLNQEDVHYLCELAYLKFQSEKDHLQETDIQLCKKILYAMCRRNKKFEFFKKFRNYFELPQSLENTTILEYRTNPDSKVSVHYLQENEKDYIKEDMTNVCQGIFTCSFILFYGENLKYYITEKCGETENVTESMELMVSREHSWKNHTVYGTLNNMMVCLEMQEEKTLNELAVDYHVKKKLNHSIFMIN